MYDVIAHFECEVAWPRGEPPMDQSTDFTTVEKVFDYRETSIYILKHHYSDVLIGTSFE